MVQKSFAVSKRDLNLNFIQLYYWDVVEGTLQEQGVAAIWAVQIIQSGAAVIPLAPPSPPDWTLRGTLFPRWPPGGLSSQPLLCGATCWQPQQAAE